MSKFFIDQALVHFRTRFPDPKGEVALEITLKSGQKTKGVLLESTVNVPGRGDMLVLTDGPMAVIYIPSTEVSALRIIAS
jgi:hypothetical protein